MSKNPIVSVLMPVYNAEKYVAEAVESVLNQTFADFEFLMIDDGSLDGSLEILQRYAKTDQRIRLVSRPNTGYVVALNEMLQLARGKYLARIDADDVALPERFAKQVEYMEQHPECVVVGSRVLLIDSDGDPLREMVELFTHEQIDNQHLEGGSSQVIHPSAIMRREAVEHVGGYLKHYMPAEDLDLFLRLAECGHVVNLPDVLTKYRQHLASEGYARQQLQRRCADAAANSARLRRGLPLLEQNSADATCPTAAEHYRKWSWWALGDGNLSTARKYAIAAMRQQPFALESWRTIYCSLRGR